MHQPRQSYRISLRGAEMVLGEKTWIMGVLNVTPDSFSDGGRFSSEDAAVRQGLALLEAGAQVVDVGGESTRPGARRVPPQEERRRVTPVLRRLRQEGAGCLSVDTTRAEVARAALDAGADMINDVSGLSFDPDMASLAAASGVPIVVMHLRGDFETVHRDPCYADVMGEVLEELRSVLRRAREAGVLAEQVIVDPGVGFSKTAEHSLEVLRRLDELAGLDRPILVGPSRKSFIGHVLDVSPEERLQGTSAAVAAAIFGGAHIVRVHDVAAMTHVARMCDAVRGDA